MKAILYAFLAAVFYAINIPASKVLLGDVGPATMSALLYLGAGIGVAGLSLMNASDRKASAPLTRKDLPYVVGMIILDIAAPIFLMLGIRHGSSAAASLLGNFEIVATTLIALFVFREAVTKRLWAAIALITLASALLSFEGADSLKFSRGSLLVIAATVCWGFENNCTRNIASKSTYQIVVLKGVFSGLGALAIAYAKHETMPGFAHAAAALVLGFVAYGLSIFMYVRAQSTLGAAKTSAYYAVAPFVGSLLSFLFLDEKLSLTYFAALAVMVAGATLVVIDTLVRRHAHPHQHTFSHFHGGRLHSHTISHTHGHDHFMSSDSHTHRHPLAELEHAAGHKTAPIEAAIKY